MGTILRMAALPLCGLALGAIGGLACASDADTQRPLSALAAQSGLPRAPEQLAVSFEHADLRFMAIRHGWRLPVARPHEP